MTRYARALAGLALVALLMGACGGGSSGGKYGAQGGGGTDLSITSPADGAQVSLPFTLKLESGVTLGPPESGNDHVHVYFDGNDSDYAVVTSDSYQVTNLSPGKHTVTASLRNADHSSAGSDATISVTVASGSGGGSGGGNGGGGNNYGSSGGSSGGY